MQRPTKFQRQRPILSTATRRYLGCWTAARCSFIRDTSAVESNRPSRSGTNDCNTQFSECDRSLRQAAATVFDIDMSFIFFLRVIPRQLLPLSNSASVK
jgi:hypothetical protein